MKTRGGGHKPVGVKMSVTRDVCDRDECPVKYA